VNGACTEMICEGNSCGSYACTTQYGGTPIDNGKGKKWKYGLGPLGQIIDWFNG